MHCFYYGIAAYTFKLTSFLHPLYAEMKVKKREMILRIRHVTYENVVTFHFMFL